MFARFCVAFTLFQFIYASHKNSEYLINIIDLLNDDESLNPTDNPFTPNKEGSDLLNSDEIEKLKDDEKEEKLRQILQLLKRNNDVNTLYKDLEKSPLTPQLFVIDNPEVLEDFKEYLHNKHSSKYRNDLNSYEIAVRRNINLNEPNKPKSKHKKRRHEGKETEESNITIQKVSQPNTTEINIELHKPSTEPFPVNEVHNDNVKTSKESTKDKDKTDINLLSKPIKRNKPKAGTKNEKTIRDSNMKPEREDNQDNSPSYVGMFLDGPSDGKKPKAVFSDEAVPNRDIQKRSTRNTHIASKKRPKPKRERPMPNYNKKPKLNIPKIPRGPDNERDSNFGSIKNRNRYDSDGPSRNRYNDNSRNSYNEYSRNRFNDDSRDRYDDNSRNRHDNYLRNRNSGRNFYPQGRTPIPIGRIRHIYERD